MQYVLYQPFATLYCLILFGKGGFYFDKTDNQGINNSTLNIIFSSAGFILQFGIKILASYHDIEIRFKFDDMLSRPITYFFVQQSVLETILIIVFASKQPIALYIFQIILGGLAILEYNRSHIFLQPHINRLYVSLQYTIILINLLLLLEMDYFDPNLIGALIFFIFTLSTKISQGLDYYKKSSTYIKMNPTENFAFGEIEYFIRSIWNYSNFFIDEYLSNWVGVHFESIKQQHILRCSKDTCFCQKYLKKVGSDDPEQENLLRDKFFKQNVLHIFQMFLKSKNRLSQPKNDNEYNVLRFSYLAYMIDVLENPLISLPYITKLNNLQFNPREQIILFLLQQQVNLRFSKIVQRREKDDWSQVIYFDTTLEGLQQKITDCLSKFKLIVVQIGLDYIQLNSLKKKIDEVMKLQQEIEIISIKLFKFNSSNKKLLELIYLYLNQFDFRRKIMKKYLNIQSNSFSKEKDFLLLVQNSCIIFSSLLKPLGIIKSYTSNTKNILEQLINLYFRLFLSDYLFANRDINMNEMIGLSCSQMIPKQIAIHHDKILRNFIENGKPDSLEVQGIDSYRALQNTKGLFFFSNQKNCFIQPVRMIFQMNQISEQDFGLCSLIKRDALMSDYILLDSYSSKTEKKMFYLSHMTKRIYNLCLKKIYKEENLIQQMDILLMIPEAMILMKDYILEVENKQKRFNISNTISTLMFYPINEQQQPIFKLEKVFHTAQGSIIQLYKELCNEEDIGLSEVECIWNHFYIKSTNSYVYYLELTKIKPIKRFGERVITIGQFRNKIQNLYNIDLSNLEEVCGFQRLKTFKQKAAQRQSIVQPKSRSSQISQLNFQQQQQQQPNASSDQKINENSSQNILNQQNIVPSIAQYTSEELGFHSSNLIPSVHIMNPFENNKYFVQNDGQIILEEMQDEILSNNQNNQSDSVQLFQIINNQQQLEEQQFFQNQNLIEKHDPVKQDVELIIQKQTSKHMQESTKEDQKLNINSSFLEDVTQSKLKQPSDKIENVTFQYLPKQLSSEIQRKFSSSQQVFQKNTSIQEDILSDLEKQQSLASSDKHSLLSQPNLLIYSSSNRKIEVQVFNSKRKQSEKLQNEIDEQSQIKQIDLQDEDKQDDLFQIDEDINDYQTEVYTQTNKFTTRTKTLSNKQKSAELLVTQHQKQSIDLTIEDVKNLQQFQQNQESNDPKSNLSITNHLENENEKYSDDQISPNFDPKASQNMINNTQQMLLMPSKKSDNQIPQTQSKRLIRNSILIQQSHQNFPYMSYLPQFRNQYTDYQVQEIINSTNNHHEDVIKRKTVQQKYYNASQYFRQFNNFNNQKPSYSAQNYLNPMNPDYQSNLDQSTSQLCTSQRFSEIKVSNNDIEDDDIVQSEIVSDQFIEELHKEFNNDNTSATSSRNELNQQKKRIIHLIYSPFNIKSLELMKFISVTLLSCLLLTVSLNYLAIKYDIDKCRIDTINIKIMGDIILYESQQIQSKTFSQLDQKYLFSFNNQISEANLNKIKGDISNSYEKYMQSIIHLNSLQDQSEIQTVIQQTQTNITDFYQDSSNIQMRQHLNYDLIRRIEHFFQYSKPIIHKNEEFQINANFLMMTDSILDILNTLYDGLGNNLNGTLNSLLLAFILSIAMSIINVSILIPIHIVGIKILDGQLKICSHFSREKLQALHSKLSKLIQSQILLNKDYSQPKSATKSQQNHMQGQNIQWKKKGTSQTDSLQYINCKFLLFIILLFVLLTVYPVFNYVYGSKFILELQQIINKMKNMEQSRISIIISSGIVNLKLYSIAYDYGKEDNIFVNKILPEKIDAYQHSIYYNQTKYIQEMKKVVSYFDDQTLILYDELRSAFLDPLQHNLCNILSSSFYNNLTILKEDCPQSFHQYLQKGLVFLLSDLSKEQDDILEQLKLIQSKQDLQSWFNQLIFPDYFLKERIISYLYLDISNLIQQSVKEMIDFVILLQYYMFLYAICQIILVQFIFQMRHFYKVTTKISKSKLIFSIFQVDFVIENSYFLSYFKNKLKFKV